jgi:hypothetical protein
MRKMKNRISIFQVTISKVDWRIEMSLQLGKSFDRNYNIRVPFLNGFYNIGVFFSKKSTFLLFSVEQDFKESTLAPKVNMYKNLEGSKFCETFIELHSYRKNTLDIQNQFKNIRPDFYSDISFLTNETINLAKIEIDDREPVYDCLNIYMLTLNPYMNEFVFLITERHNIVKKLRKKIVRTSGLQIATTPALKMIDEYHTEFKNYGKEGLRVPVDRSDQIISLE